MQARLELEIGYQVQRITNVDDSAVVAGWDIFPLFGLGGKDPEATLGVEKDRDAACVGVGEVSGAGSLWEFRPAVVLQHCPVIRRGLCRARTAGVKQRNAR